ncbi:hypothetical protein EBU58_11145, partial [bacterium]|nr:hypothetical protein [bacterium]
MQLVWPMILLSLSAQVATQEATRTLFEFTGPAAAREWQAVNDGVMGGVSDGRFRIMPEKTMEFFGTLSLENNGGFASVRSKPTALNIKAGDVIVVRVKGDGREYVLNLIEGATGGRFHPNFDRIGGLKDDLPKGWIDETKQVMKKLRRFCDEIDDLLFGNEIFQSRMRGVGVIPSDIAL